MYRLISVVFPQAQSPTSTSFDFTIVGVLLDSSDEPFDGGVNGGVFRSSPIFAVPCFLCSQSMF